MSAVVVAGEALIDLVIDATGRIDDRPGGGPFNTALVLGRLGVPTAFLGRISTDAFGRLLRRELAWAGVDDRLVVTTDDPTTLALAELDAAGEATYRFYLDGTSAPGLTDASLPDDAEALHVGTLGLLLEPIGTALEALVRGAPDTTLVMLDVNARPGAARDPAPWRARIARIAARADVVKASRSDLAHLGSRPEDLLALGARAVLVTAGPDPLDVVTPSDTTTVAVPARHAGDAVGSGDAFGGGFLAAWMRAGGGRPGPGDGERLLAAARGGIAAAVAAIDARAAGASFEPAPVARAGRRAG